MVFKLPKKDFYSIDELSKEWDCSTADIEHLIYSQKTLRLAVKISNIRFLGGEQLSHIDKEDPECTCDLADYNSRRLRVDEESRENIYDRLCLADKNNKTICWMNGYDYNTIEVPENFDYEAFIYINNDFLPRLGHVCPIDYFGTDINQGVKKIADQESIENQNYQLTISDHITGGKILVCDTAEYFSGEKIIFKAVQTEWCEKKRCSLIFSYEAGIAFRKVNCAITAEEKDRFEQNYLITDPENKTKISFSLKERNSLLKLVLGMAIKKYNYDPNSSRNNATGTNSGSIHADLEKCGINIDKDTIRKYLNEAKELISMGEVSQ